MFEDDYATVYEARPELLPVDLQRHILEFDRIVAVHDPFRLDRENAVELFVLTRHKRRSFLCRFFCKSPVKLFDIFILQKFIGIFDGCDIPDSELLRQSALPGSK